MLYLSNIFNGYRKTGFHPNVLNMGKITCDKMCINMQIEKSTYKQVDGNALYHTMKKEFLLSFETTTGKFIDCTK